MGRIGETLRKARELREIDLREISDATKINIRYLEAIEINHFDLLPGGVFNKGFIRAYANYIGLDGQTMVDNYVHDLEAGPDEANAPGAAPSGLHRPAEIPQRRAALDAPGRGESDVGTDPPSASKSSHGSSAIHLTSLQDIVGARADSPPPASGERVLPRIAWMMAATGLVFCILAAWRYIAEAPRPPIQAEQTDQSQPPSTETPAVTPPPVSPAEAAIGADGGAADAAGAKASATAREAASTEPQIAAIAPAAEDRRAVDPPEPAPAAADTTGTGRSGQAPPSGVDDRPAALPEPESLVAEKVESGMTMVLTARAAARVRVICDGREAADRRMSRGEVASLHCEHLIRLSAPDASSIELTINGSACAPLGAPGSRLFGFVIRADDYRDLCPDQSGGTDASR